MIRKFKTGDTVRVIGRQDKMIVISSRDGLYYLVPSLACSAIGEFWPSWLLRAEGEL